MRPQVPEKLEFVRTALPEDTHGDPNASLWLDDRGQYWWLTSRDVVSLSLGDKLRDGVEAEKAHGISPEARDAGRPNKTPPVVSQTPSEWMRAQDVQVLEGRTEDWRWWVIGDEIALDNRPRVERLANEGQAVPTLYQAVVPVQTLRVIAGQGVQVDP